MPDLRPREPRKPVSLLVRLNLPDEAAFAERYALNLSKGGMFVQTREPKPAGTLLQFRIELADGARVLQGLAAVAWIRGPNDPRGPAGMGLKFDLLDEASRALVDRIVAASASRKEASPPVPSIPSVAPLVPPVAIADPPRGAGSENEEEAGVEIDLGQLLAETAPPKVAPAPIKPPAPPLDLEIDPDTTLLPPELVPEQPPPRAAPAPPPVRPVTAPAAAPRAPEPPPVALPKIVRGPVAPSQAQAAPVMLKAEPQVAKPAGKKPAEPEVAIAGKPVFLPPVGTVEGKGPIIGVDLGTTNSCVAVMSKGKPTVLRSKDGYSTIPTVLALNNQGKVLVGHRAKQQLILNPTRTVYGAKRLVGREFLSATVRQVKSRFHYEIISDNVGRAAVKLGNHAITLEEAQGLVLRECKEMAEQELGCKVERAVITCPAYYSEPQREAVRRAGALAGLKVERILNEPTAAALAYGVNKGLSWKVLVYDLGGGTFDATVLRIEKNVFEVLGTGGDIFLGGVDFDNQLVDFLVEKLKEQPELEVDVKADPVLLSRIAEAAERAKIALSERTVHEVHIPMLMMGPEGKPVDLRETVRRSDLNKMCLELVDRTLEVVQDVLLDAKLKPQEIDEVILVGGQSRMPLVRDRLTDLFKKQPHASVHADEAVALGAALYTATVDKLSDLVLIDVVPMTIGVGQAGGAFRRVIQRNTPLPAQKSFSLPTVADNQRSMELSIFQGEDASVAANEYLGTVRVDGLPAAPKGVVQVAVTLKLDAECVLHVEACELKTRARVNATIATRYTPAELQKRLNISAEKVAEAEARRGKDLEKRGGKFWSLLKKFVGK